MLVVGHVLLVGLRRSELLEASHALEVTHVTLRHFGEEGAFVDETTHLALVFS